MSGQSLTRRRFLGLSGLSIGAIALTPALSSCRSHSGSVYDALGKTSIATDALGIDTISFVGGAVLAASGGARIVRSAFTTNTIDLVRGETVVATFGTNGDPSVLNLASDAAFAPDGTVWVVDRGRGAIVQLDPSFRLIDTHTSLGDAVLRSPSGIDSLADGRLVVTDTWTGVHLVDPTAGSGGTLRSTKIVAVPQRRGGRVLVPREVAVTVDDRIVVHDRSNGIHRRLLQFSTNGAQSAEPVAITGIPTSIAVAPSGDVVAIDSSNHTVTRTRPDGTTSTASLHADPNHGILIRTLQGKDMTLDGATTMVPRGIAFDRSSSELVVGLPTQIHTFHVHTKGDLFNDGNVFGPLTQTGD